MLCNDSNTGTLKKLIPKFKGLYKIDKVLKNDRYILKYFEGSLRPWLGERAQVRDKDRNQEISIIRMAEL